MSIFIHKSGHIKRWSKKEPIWVFLVYLVPEGKSWSPLWRCSLRCIWFVFSWWEQWNIRTWPVQGASGKGALLCLGSRSRLDWRNRVNVFWVPLKMEIMKQLQCSLSAAQEMGDVLWTVCGKDSVVVLGQFVKSETRLFYTGSKLSPIT